MRRLTVLTSSVLVGLFLFVGCSNSNEKANALYVKASVMTQDVIAAKRNNCAKALVLYEGARKNVDIILSKYPSSTVAVQLIAGDRKISGLSFVEFVKLGEYLKTATETEQDPLYCAVFVAKAIGDPSWRCRALAAIARMYAKAGQEEKADQILSDALESAKSIADESDKKWRLEEIADAYIEVGQKGQAALVLSQLLAYRGVALDRIAGKYAELGQKEKAAQILAKAKEEEVQGLSKEFEIAKVIDLPRDGFRSPDLGRPSALADVAGRYAELGQKEKAAQILSQAVEAAKTMKKPGWAKPEALEAIAVMYAKARFFSQALETAKIIEEPSYRFRALADIAGKYAEDTYFSQAFETAKLIEEPLLKSKALENIAVAYAKAGRFSDALKTAKTIDNPPYSKTSLASSLIAVAGNYIEAAQKEQTGPIPFDVLLQGEHRGAGLEKKAAVVLSIALEVANTIEDRKDKSSALIYIAEKYTQAGQKEQGIQILSQAHELAKTIEEPSSKLGILVTLARTYVEVGQKKQAVQILSQVLELAKTNDQPNSYDLLAQIARGCAEGGLFPEALEIAKAFEYPGQRSTALNYIAIKYAEAGLFPEALETAKTIEDQFEKRSALQEIEGSYVEAGLFSEALETANTIGDPTRKGVTWARVSVKCAEVGQRSSKEALTILNDIFDIVYAEHSTSGTWK